MEMKARDVRSHPPQQRFFNCSPWAPTCGLASLKIWLTIWMKMQPSTPDRGSPSLRPRQLRLHFSNALQMNCFPVPSWGELKNGPVWMNGTLGILMGGRALWMHTVDFKAIACHLTMMSRSNLWFFSFQDSLLNMHSFPFSVHFSTAWMPNWSEVMIANEEGYRINLIITVYLVTVLHSLYIHPTIRMCLLCIFFVFSGTFRCHHKLWASSQCLPQQWCLGWVGRCIYIRCFYGGKMGLHNCFWSKLPRAVTGLSVLQSAHQGHPWKRAF